MAVKKSTTAKKKRSNPRTGIEKNKKNLKKASAKKTSPRKATTGRISAKKSLVKKSTAKKLVAKRKVIKKKVVKKTVAKKTVTKKVAVKKPVAKKAVTKKVAVKKSVAKKAVTKKVATKQPVAKKKVVVKKPVAKKVAAKKVATKKPTAKKVVIKKTVAKNKRVTKKVATKKLTAKKPVVKKVVAKKAVTKKTVVKKVATKKPMVKKTVVKKTAEKKSTVKKTVVKKLPMIEKKIVQKSAKNQIVNKEGRITKRVQNTLRGGVKRSDKVKTLNPKIISGKPMKSKLNAVVGVAVSRKKDLDLKNKNISSTLSDNKDNYMDLTELLYFKSKLINWKKSLMEEVDRTVSHMKDEAANFPDPNDRASLEEEFSLELRARDRERKLISKIDEALQAIQDEEYGYCEACGIEIGIKRLEARPTATQCIDCKTLDEIREKQLVG